MNLLPPLTTDSQCTSELAEVRISHHSNVTLQRNYIDNTPCFYIIYIRPSFISSTRGIITIVTRRYKEQNNSLSVRRVFIITITKRLRCSVSINKKNKFGLDQKLSPSPSHYLPNTKPVGLCGSRMEAT